jgi:hypothetical protein
MTITRPLSLPVIHPPSISSISIPGMRMNMHGQEEDQFEDEPLPRPRNASFDVPLLQRTLATLQEQVGLLTPPESVANVDTHSRTPSRRGSDSTRLSAGTVTKLQTLVNSMFDLLVSRIGQKVIPYFQRHLTGRSTSPPSQIQSRLYSCIACTM